MTRGTTRLQGRTLEVDGEELVVWTEEGHDRFSAVVFNDAGDEVGYATATRSARHPSTAHLTIGTSRAFRRRGLGREILGTIIGWAEDELIEFLVGTAPARDAAVRKFLSSSGRPVATRTTGGSAEFAIQAPRLTHTEDDHDAVARALEAGASLAEADALRSRTALANHHLAA